MKQRSLYCAYYLMYKPSVLVGEQMSSSAMFFVSFIEYYFFKDGSCIQDGGKIFFLMNF
jgi:hypothetical protein